VGLFKANRSPYNLHRFRGAGCFWPSLGPNWAIGERFAITSQDLICIERESARKAVRQSSRGAAISKYREKDVIAEESGKTFLIVCELSFVDVRGGAEEGELSPLCDITKRQKWRLSLWGERMWRSGGSNAWHSRKVFWISSAGAREMYLKLRIHMKSSSESREGRLKIRASRCYALWKSEMGNGGQKKTVREERYMSGVGRRLSIIREAFFESKHEGPLYPDRGGCSIESRGLAQIQTTLTASSGMGDKPGDFGQNARGNRSVQNGCD